MSNTLNAWILSVLMSLGLSGAGAAVAEQPAGFSPAYSQAELDQMLAPVALYPDTVLSQLLIAATYPLEVVQAARWSRANGNPRGAEALALAESIDWDPSVQALTAFPDLLDRMDRDIEWTQRLGDAFLLQEDQVVGTIQQLRAQAYAQGHLYSNERVRVVRETEYIYIEPAQTRVVYLPYYDPRVVYGRWWWSAHPPVYWHPPAGFSFSLGFYWGSAYRLAPQFYFSSFHWPRRQVVVIHHDYRDRHYRRPHSYYSGRSIARHDGARHWRHDPRHRRGVDYRGHVDPRHFSSAPGGREPSGAGRQPSARQEGPGARRDLRTAERALHERASATVGGDRLATGRGPRSAADARAGRDLDADRRTQQRSAERLAKTLAGSAARSRAAVQSRSRDSAGFAGGERNRTAAGGRSRSTLSPSALEPSRPTPTVRGPGASQDRSRIVRNSAERNADSRGSSVRNSRARESIASVARQSRPVRRDSPSGQFRQLSRPSAPVLETQRSVSRLAGTRRTGERRAEASRPAKASSARKPGHDRRTRER